ncbi:Relaxase, partial [Pseudomonas cannabina]
LPGDAKGTNLKDTIFQDDFIVRRELKKPPLEASVIQERLLAWPQRAREIKYVNKATPKFRKAYSEASPEDRVRLLAEREARFYQTYGESHDSVHTGQRQRDHQRSPAETAGRRTAAPADGLQDLSVS